MTHIGVSKLTIIGSDNGLSPGWPQVIIWTNAGILSIGPLATKFSEILIEIHIFSLKKCIWNCRLQNGGHFPRPQCVKPILYVLLVFHWLRHQVKCFSHMHPRVPKASDNWSGLLYLPPASLQEAGLLGTRWLWVVNMQDTHWGAADW